MFSEVAASGAAVLAAINPINPESIISGAGPWALVVVCAIVFAETGLLIGFVLPGDTLLFFTGLLTYTGVISAPLWLVLLAVSLSAILGDQLGYFIGYRTGPRIFERKDSGLFSTKNVARTQQFFDKYGGTAVILARFVAVVRTFAPVAAGVGKMHYLRFLGYNAIGAVAWAFIVILLGYFLGHIPGVADVVTQYIDVVIIGIVVISLGTVLVQVLRSRRKQGKQGES
ncbi:DedA family protein [Subtercola frigoramans]|uniref:Membrane-associated protein n=1 Tax=Subtercola frigoramans TaxID=120298 RepID=A0ABS2L235_9MICO|nr:DedA family protein [Subtercola frigoramans]MBM7471069.1 membrane-associated protein [Subtercola frigoramans]